jgi:hypothetical protein
MIKRLRKPLVEKRWDRQDVRIKGRKLPRVAEILERHSEVVAFAEAGVQDLAQQMIRREVQERKKILVVGSGGAFSRPLVDYALGFAKRMGYEIVALDCVPIGQGARKALNPNRQEIREGLPCKATEGARLLASRAAEEGIPCHHVMKFGTPDRCIRELHGEIRRVELVLTEPEASPDEGVEPAISVYCVAT